ncbi:MAG: N-acetyltransferase [Betaproteobacteria bacterium]|nr:MAG: N-acetyltransferase [Betaproteobacteria bacterium]
MNPFLRPARSDEIDFAFEVKRDAMGPHIVTKWAWDEDFQMGHHSKRWAERTWYIICCDSDRIGTVALDWEATHLRFGEFYILGKHHGQGIGSKVLRDVLAQADTRSLETRLEFLKWNPVGSLYRRYGFKVVAENEIHYLAVRPARTADSPSLF